MKILPIIFSAACLTLPAFAQTGAQQPSGEKHIYKTVGDVQLPLYVLTPEGHEASHKVPAIVFFFGGGWKSGSPGQFDPHCKHVTSKAMVGITVEYRVSSRHPVKIDDCIEDARSAIRWVRSNADKLGIDPDRIVAGGGSAGGHLAAMTALTDKFDAQGEDKKVSAEPNAMVLFNPAMAIAPDERLAAESSEQIGGHLANRSRSPVKDISPLTYASKKQPPCIMFFGTADKLLAGAETFAKVSTDAGNECRIVTYDGQGHGFFNFGRNDNKYYDLTVSEMDSFLARHGFQPPQ